MNTPQPTKEQPDGNPWLFLLMIVMVVFWAIIKSPYLIAKGIYSYFKELIADQHPNLLHKRPYNKDDD